MNKLKIIFIICFAMLVSTSCSLLDKMKEKFSSNKDNQTKEKTVDKNGEDNKEKTTEITSGDDLAFYNKYIDVSNKLQESGEGIHKSYVENIPSPKNIRKGMILVTVGFDFKVEESERTVKELRRSFYDGGELSKLKAPSEMKTAIEESFKAALDDLDKLHSAAKDVSDYYRTKEYESEHSKAMGYDDDIKAKYDKFKDSFDKFSATLKKYKPKKNQRDPSTISDPDQRSIAVLMNAYKNTLEKAEVFYDHFRKVDKSGDLTEIKKDINDLESAFADEKRNVQNSAFTDVTKGFKYSFEDYFSKTVGDFVREARKFVGKGGAKESEFDRSYDNVIQYYNYMINAYNTSITSLNTMNKF